MPRIVANKRAVTRARSLSRSDGGEVNTLAREMAQLTEAERVKRWLRGMRAPMNSRNGCVQAGLRKCGRRAPYRQRWFRRRGETCRTRRAAIAIRRQGWWEAPRRTPQERPTKPPRGPGIPEQLSVSEFNSESRPWHNNQVKLDRYTGKSRPRYDDT